MSVILDDTNNLFVGTIADDTVSGLAGSDSLFGFQGNDSLFGNLEDDLIFGGQGVDILFGGQGNDTVLGGVENDNVAGEAGDDLINGNKGNDFIVGGEGLDSLFGGQGDDLIQGEDGNDWVIGNFGNDSIFGGVGDDTLFGDDTVSSSEQTGIDIIYGGKGNDVVVGGNDGDALFGDDGDDSVSGEAGNDLMGGGLGADTLEGGSGDDFISGGKGNDRLSGNGDTDTLTGGEGADVFIFVGEDLPDANGSSDVLITADIVTDFLPNQDFIQLGGSLQFSDLRIEQGNGLNIKDTIISNRETNQVIAVLLNVPANVITEQTFNVPTDLTGTDGGTDGGTDAGLTVNPKLQGAELLVANQTGVIGTVAASGAESYTVTTVENNTGTAVADAVTIDATSGELTLTEAGVTALAADGVDYLEVTIETQAGDPGSLRIYDSIAAAIADEEIGNGTDTSVGEAEDTIRVAAGTYAEDLNITKSVKLLAPNAGTAGNAERVDEANLTGDVVLVAPQITLDGFQLTGSQVNATGSGDSLTVINNRFEGTTGGGIDVQLTEVHTNLTIENNVFAAMIGTAIRAQRWGENSKISGNTIEITQAGADIDGIEVDSLTGTTISNNTIETPAAGGSGIEIGGSQSTGGASSEVTLSENTITGADGAGTANTDGGITLRDGNFTTLSITDNTISGYSAAETTGSLLIATGTEIPSADAVSITGNILAVASPGFSIYVASTDVPTLNVAGNFSATGTALIAANVNDAGSTEFNFA